MTDAVQKYERPKDVGSLLRSDYMKQQISQALPSHMTPDRMMRVALTAILRTPKLNECTVESVAKALLDCSAIGLEPDGRRAHLIPYGTSCTLIIDYKGLIELAKRNGDVALWRPVAVKANDKFSWKNGNVKHEINWLADRGALVAVYSHVRGKDGVDDYEVMTLAECEAIRKRSRAGNAGPWVTDFEAMCMKSAMRRHSKRLVLSPEFRDALDRDADSYAEVNAEVVNVSPSPREALNKKMAEAMKEQREEAQDIPDDIPMEFPPAAVVDDMPEVMQYLDDSHVADPAGFKSTREELGIGKGWKNAAPEKLKALFAALKAKVGAK